MKYLDTFPSSAKDSWKRKLRHSLRSISLASTLSRYCRMKYHTCDGVSISRNWNPALVTCGAPLMASAALLSTTSPELQRMETASTETPSF